MKITGFIQMVQQIAFSPAKQSKFLISGDAKTQQVRSETIDAEEFHRNWEEYKKGIEEGSILRSTSPKITPINISTIGAAVWQKIKEKIGLGGTA